MLSVKCKKCGSEWTVKEEYSTSIINCPFCGANLAKEEPITFANIQDCFRALIDKYGKEVLADGKRLYSFLTDYIPEKEKELRILKIACEANVYKYFVDAKGRRIEMEQRRVVKILTEDYMIAEKWAIQLVEWGCNAIGLECVLNSKNVKIDRQEKSGEEGFLSKFAKNENILVESSSSTNRRTINTNDKQKVGNKSVFVWTHDIYSKDVFKYTFQPSKTSDMGTVDISTGLFSAKYISPQVQDNRVVNFEITNGGYIKMTADWMPKDLIISKDMLGKIIYDKKGAGGYPGGLELNLKKGFTFKDIGINSRTACVLNWRTHNPFIITPITYEDEQNQEIGGKLVKILKAN